MTAILRKHGVEATINFSLFEVDGVDFRVDAVHASGDSAIMKDEGTEGNTANSFTDEGNGYSLVLTATEMTAARIVIYLVDQTATKIWLDTKIIIETYGHASAQHAFDLDTASTAQTADHTAGIAAIPTTAMRGTDSAALASVCTETRLAALTDWLNGGRLDLLLDAIPTTAMRGTDSALTSLPSIPANWITAAGIAANALNGKGNWNVGKTGYSLTITPPTAAAISTQVWSETTRTLTAFTIGVNVAQINSAPVLGDGTAENLWRG